MKASVFVYSYTPDQGLVFDYSYTSDQAKEGFPSPDPAPRRFASCDNEFYESQERFNSV